MPYWIVRNSYGDGWGMNGDFHVRRGFDDFGADSILANCNSIEILELMNVANLHSFRFISKLNNLRTLNLEGFKNIFGKTFLHFTQGKNIGSPDFL
jgi:hypothetical protein